MKQKVITLIRGLKLITVLWLVTPDAMAQNCQVVVSRPEIQLGKQIHVANAGTLFTQQEMTVAAECVGTGPITLLIDGTPDEGGQHFRFGTAGSMTLTLLTAQYDGGDTGLRLSSALQGKGSYRRVHRFRCLLAARLPRSQQGPPGRRLIC